LQSTEGEYVNEKPVSCGETVASVKVGNCTPIEQ